MPSVIITEKKATQRIVAAAREVDYARRFGSLQDLSNAYVELRYAIEAADKETSE